MNEIIMDTKEEQFQELSFYTLSLRDEVFIHQHIVDAYAAQTADKSTKAIKITFALVGLYLFVERNFSGREVQLFHVKMSKNKRPWPEFVLPLKRGDINVSDVLAISPGSDRINTVRKWCESVWEAYKINRSEIVSLTAFYLNE